LNVVFRPDRSSTSDAFTINVSAIRRAKILDRHTGSSIQNRSVTIGYQQTIQPNVAFLAATDRELTGVTE
jgi:hypothetical protein